MITWLRCTTNCLPPSGEEVWCIVKIEDHDQFPCDSWGCRRLITVGTFSPESGWWFRNGFQRNYSCAVGAPGLREAEMCEYWAPIDAASRIILNNAKWRDD